YLSSSTFNNNNYASYFTNISNIFSLNNSTFSIDYLQKSDECTHKYIYIQTLPSKFNNDLLEKCTTLNKWVNMCEYLTNYGLGPVLNYSTTNLYATNQFSLDVIFHNRMKQYKCLTNISSKASAIYVPFYAGLDAGRYLWDNDHGTKIRDNLSIELFEFLKKKPEWDRMLGRDHFLVAGRVSWDFRRMSDNVLHWGNCLFNLPEAKNITSLVIESSPWSNNDFAIPYPTYFHPKNDHEIYSWQERLRRKQRPYLFSFAGAPRPQLQDSIRNEIINQCLTSKGKYCKFVKCDPNIKNCDEPKNVMKLFQSSVFCLQPPGDSYTRRSAFDAILGGCIPVFFHPASSYVQYVWHFPKNYTSYSVFIPMEDVMKGEFAIEKRLLEITKEEIVAMREEVISLIPKVIYANPNSRLERFEDAFDIALKGVLRRIERIKMDMKRGNNDDNTTIEGFPEEYAWKYNFFGGLENHEWDSYFSRGLMIHRRARAQRGKVHKTTMALCKKNCWLLIISLFTIWSILICLNYSSLINSVTSLAKLYVYSVNYNQRIPIISHPSETRNISSTIHDGYTNTTISNIEKMEEEETGETEEKTEETGEKIEKTGERVYDEIDKLFDMKNINDIVEKNDIKEEDDQNQSIKYLMTAKETMEEKPQRIPLPPRKKRRRGKSKRRKPSKILPKSNPKTMNTIVNQQSSLDKNAEEMNSKVLSPPPPSPPPPPPSPPPPPPRTCNMNQKSDPKSCSGRYIFVQTLPRRFNVDLLRDCKSLDQWMDMCQYVRNSGLGPDLPNVDRVFSKYGWYATNQFLLEVIFHNRMKQYDCLTNDSSIASAIFVPFYAGLDVARHLWNSNSEVRDSSGYALVRLLKRKTEWKKWWGRDHFFVAGRITWDFRRSANKNDPDWGTNFLYLPESKNMTGLVIESSPWNSNDFGIPYPTYFHPANDAEVFQWQNRVRKQRRENLFSFAGAPRPDRPDSIRNQLISQCENSEKCMLIHCNNWKNKCHKPAELMKMFQSSVFCLQPPGDSYTRRSTFDSILAGCIPVFFHPGSAYIQYLWHFPREFTKYSVFIPMYEVRNGNVSIQKVLENIPTQKVEKMREEIINLIPSIIYADPRCKLETLEDAFDVALKGVLERVRSIKDDMRKGRDDSFGYDERQAWKYRWLGKLEEHEWDPYFSGSFDSRNFTNF
ncbi:Xyloglucan galactosyltransferase MUR3, partial [Bienertia sinuspersici]